MSDHPTTAKGSKGAEALAAVGEVAAFLRVRPKTLYRWRYSGLGSPACRAVITRRPRSAPKLPSVPSRGLA